MILSSVCFRTSRPRAASGLTPEITLFGLFVVASSTPLLRVMVRVPISGASVREVGC
ncbi:hypothetical protein [Streptomyces sp. NPDC048445]|uniref:hypothetical protein n=1 Tax=Streptomyces sp. NPDC048445 TaxID=3365553 RepID=UPI0037148FDE